MQRLDSEFSFDLRAHCSAILASRLRSIVDIVGLCGLHFSVQIEIENVVETNWNKLVLSIPAHPFLEVMSHSLTDFAVNRNHVTTVMSQAEILSSIARDLGSAARHFVCTNESSIQRSEQTVFIISFETAKLHHLGSIHHWLFDRISHLLLHLGQSSMGMCSLQLLCSSSSSPFKPLRTTLGFVPSNRTPTELPSSFHSSKFQPSFHEVSVGHVCADF